MRHSMGMNDLSACRRVTAASILFVGLAVAACAASPSERAKELDTLYVHGQSDRKQMDARGEAASDASCAKRFTALGRDVYTERGSQSGVPKDFIELRRTYYLNGCMGRPKEATGTATPTGTTPTATGSPSST